MTERDATACGERLRDPQIPNHREIIAPPGGDVDGVLWLLVTVSRKWTKPEHRHRMRAAFQVVARRHPHRQIGIVHGAARGGDTMADEVAQELGWLRDPVPCTPEEWGRFGRSAGHRRNARMVARRVYRGCIAFPLGESPGTRGCMKLAAAAGIPVWNRGDPSLADGLYRVATDDWCAGFVVQGGRVVDRAPILSRRLDDWWTAAVPVPCY